jgi:hypothetical protein
LLIDANAELVGEPSITVISREKLPELSAEDQMEGGKSV